MKPLCIRTIARRLPTTLQPSSSCAGCLTQLQLRNLSTVPTVGGKTAGLRRNLPAWRSCGIGVGNMSLTKGGSSGQLWGMEWGAGPSCGTRRSMFIQTSATPNPASLKFHPGREVLPETHGSGLYYVKGDRSAQQSPLAKKLLAMEGITSVFLGRDFITVTKADEEQWPLLKPGLFGAIMDFYAEGNPVVLDEPVISDTTILEDDDEVVAMIKELLEERIRPAVQEDGGDLFFKGFDPETGVVKLQMAGSCSGCPSSSVTLKNGVENMLMHYIPEVTAVEEYVDHELIDVNKNEVDLLEMKLKKAGIPYSD